MPVDIRVPPRISCFSDTVKRFRIGPMFEPIGLHLKPEFINGICSKESLQGMPCILKYGQQRKDQCNDDRYKRDKTEEDGGFLYFSERDFGDNRSNVFWLYIPLFR